MFDEYSTLNTSKKTSQRIVLPLHWHVKQILDNNNGQFPRKISSQKLNDYIKLVCKDAKINAEVYGAKQVKLKDKVSSAVSGEYKSKLYGSGLEFEEVREYVFGDDIRDIDWRVTARTGKTHSKLFKIDSEQIVNIVVDINPTMHFGTQKTFKSIQAAKTAALIGWNSFQNNNKVGGLVFGGAKKEAELFRPTKTKQSLLRLLQTLCQEEVGKIHIPLHKHLNVIC